MKRIVCLGGGPAGLYSAILFKKALPRARVEVYERNRPDDTFGWGVVFSDQTMEGFRDGRSPSRTPPSSAASITGTTSTCTSTAQRVRSGGHGFCRHRAQAAAQHPAGARRRARRRADTSSTRSQDEAEFADADLVIAADGVNSRVRAALTRRSSSPNIDVRKCRFIWLGTTQTFPAFTFAFEQTEHGWFQIHAYQFSNELSTVIVETREETWRAHGLDALRHRAVDRVLRAAVRQVPRRPRAHEQRRASARLGLAQFQSRAVQALASRQHRADRRCRAHRALLASARARSSRWKMRSSLVAARRARRRRRRGARSLPGGAQPRSAEAAERGAQSHGVVRERRALRAPRAACSSRTAC